MWKLELGEQEEQLIKNIQNKQEIISVYQKQKASKKLVCWYSRKSREQLKSFKDIAEKQNNIFESAFITKDVNETPILLLFFSYNKDEAVSE